MSRTGRCEHGRLLRHAPELTTVAAATSGRPSGLHAMACHTASMVAPSDPRWKAATVGGFTFGGSDPPYCILAVQAEKDGITTISGELMGKSLSILHIVVTLSQPPPYIRTALHLSVLSLRPYGYGFTDRVCILCIQYYKV